MTTDLLIWMARFAGVIIAVSYIPQQLRIVANKSSKDVSPTMYYILLVALIIYEIYAVVVREPVFMFTNALSMIQCGVMLGLIIWYREK